MRHFFTFSVAALMASFAVTVHGIPVVNGGAVHDAKSIQPLSLNTEQLTQCVTQILEGSEVCNLSLLDGLIPGLFESVGGVISLDDHVLDLNALTDLVNKVVNSLIKDGTCKKASDCQVDSVLKTAKNLLENLPVTKAANVGDKRDLVSDVNQVLEDNGLTLADLRNKVESVIQKLGLPYISLTRLPLQAQKEVCSLFNGLDLHGVKCEDILTFLDEQKSKVNSIKA